MSEITLEKTHALLEKLAAYVMTELPTRKELDEKLALKTDKTDLNRLERRVDQLDQKVERIDRNVGLILEGMDAMAQEQEINRMERTAVSKTLDVYNVRLGDLEEHAFGSRVRDKEDDDHNSKKI